MLNSSSVQNNDLLLSLLLLRSIVLEQTELPRSNVCTKSNCKPWKQHFSLKEIVFQFRPVPATLAFKRDCARKHHDRIQIGPICMPFISSCSEILIRHSKKAYPLTQWARGFVETTPGPLHTVRAIIELDGGNGQYCMLNEKGAGQQTEWYETVVITAEGRRRLVLWGNVWGAAGVMYVR